MQAVILAAGYGTRLYPITADRAKPLVEAGGKTILDYLIEKLLRQEIIDGLSIVVNDRFHTQFLDWQKVFEKTAGKSLPLTIINDGTTSNQHRLGAIRDLSLALSGIDEMQAVLISAADDIFCFPFRPLIETYLERDSSVIALIKSDDPDRISKSGNGLIDDEGRVIEMVEKPEKPISSLLSPCLYILHAVDRKLLDEYLEGGNNPDAPGYFIAWLIRKTTVYSTVFSEPVYSIGDIEEYKKVCRLFKTNPPL